MDTGGWLKIYDIYLTDRRVAAICRGRLSPKVQNPPPYPGMIDKLLLDGDQKKNFEILLEDLISIRVYSGNWLRSAYGKNMEIVYKNNSTRVTKSFAITVDQFQSLIETLSKSKSFTGKVIVPKGN